jgi:hypothetical protein
MKQRASVLLVLSCMAYCGCDSSTSVAPSSSKIQAYFPLQVGNQWIYQRSAYGDSGNVDRLDTISNSVESSGIAYGKSGFYLSDRNGQIFAYYSGNDVIRIDPGGSRIFYKLRYPMSPSEEIVLIDSTINGGHFRSAIRLISDSVSVTVPAGTFNCIAYRTAELYGEHGVMDTNFISNFYLGYGVGFVKDETYFCWPFGKKDLMTKTELMSYVVK